MLNLRARSSVSRALAPIGGGLHRLGVSANVITVVGTAGSVASAVLLLGTGRFFLGVVAITVFVLFDLLDGAVARAGATASRFGAVLDSTLDRIADASIFAALIWWFAGSADRPDLIVACLIALVLGQLIPYVRARAEGLGINASVGIAERAVRLTVVLTGVGLSGLGLPIAVPIALWLLNTVGVITVGQRLNAVRRAASTPLPAPLPAPPPGATGD
ncbi:MAG: CDP-alcohol phosphatidyltransferase family protein [Geodermatophilaceae bacterium]|nr:CDP-alcohol phosphatidyltransferase family protein [Geodermatophilaceae bacterium]